VITKQDRLALLVLSVDLAAFRAHPQNVTVANVQRVYAAQERLQDAVPVLCAALDTVEAERDQWKLREDHSLKLITTMRREADELVAQAKQRATDTARDALHSLYLYGRKGRGPGGHLYDIIRRNRPDVAEYMDEHGDDETWKYFFGAEDT
jgi:hypothetical protein